MGIWQMHLGGRDRDQGAGVIALKEVTGETAWTTTGLGAGPVGTGRSAFRGAGSMQRRECDDVFGRGGSFTPGTSGACVLRLTELPQPRCDCSWAAAWAALVCVFQAFDRLQVALHPGVDPQ